MLMPERMGIQRLQWGRLDYHVGVEASKGHQASCLPWLLPICLFLSLPSGHPIFREAHKSTKWASLAREMWYLAF